MIERIRKKYAMTEKGAKDYVAAVFWSVLVNISKMLPVGVLATALSGIVEALTNGTDPGAGLTRFLVAGVLALAAVRPRFFMDLPTPFSSVRMVGKKRKTTRSPRMNGVGIRRRDKNAESIPGGVVIRSHDTRKIGDRFQNLRT